MVSYGEASRVSEQEYAEVRGGLGNTVRLVVRTLVYVVLGGLALIALVTVMSVLGPAIALDLYTPPVAAWWTVFTAVVVRGVPFLLLGTVVSAAIGVLVPERVFSRLLPRAGGRGCGRKAAREVPDEDEDPHDQGSDHTHTTGPRLVRLLALPTAAYFSSPRRRSAPTARRGKTRIARHRASARSRHCRPATRWT
jgi:hypothetical protein